MLGDQGLLVELDSTDSTEVLSLNEYNLNLLKKEFGLEGDAKAVKAALFPSAKKSFIPNLIKETPVVEEPVVEEPVVEEVVEDGEAPLDMDWSELTVKELKVVLTEKGLSTEGKKADLVERLSEAE